LLVTDGRSATGIARSLHEVTPRPAEVGISPRAEEGTAGRRRRGVHDLVTEPGVHLTRVARHAPAIVAITGEDHPAPVGHDDVVSVGAGEGHHLRAGDDRGRLPLARLPRHTRPR